MKFDNLFGKKFRHILIFKTSIVYNKFWSIVCSEWWTFPVMAASNSYFPRYWCKIIWIKPSFQMYIHLFNASKCNAALKFLQLPEAQIKVDQTQTNQNLKVNTNKSKYSLLLCVSFCIYTKLQYQLLLLHSISRFS